MPPLLKPTLKPLSSERANPELVAVTSLINLMNELAGILVDEVELVSARRQAEHAALLKRKQRLTVDYRAGMQSVASQPEMLKNLPPDIRSALKMAATKLADITDRNARALRTAVMATQRLIQNIISIVKQEALTKTTYSNPSTAHMALGTYSPVCKPVAVSRTA